MADRQRFGRWTLTVTGNATLDSDGKHALALHGSPLLDDAPLTGTELLAAAGSGWTPLIHRLTGSFAFLLLDHDSGRVRAVRDFIGTKPLAWGERGSDVAVATEALAAPVLLGLPLLPDEGSIDRYLKGGGYRLTQTMVDGVRSFPPNSISTIAASHVVSEPVPVPVEAIDAEDDEVLTETARLVDRAVRRSIVDSTRVLAAASAGVDSSVVAASGLRQGLVESIVTTRTVGLDEWDEVPRATLIADRYGVPQHVVDVPGPDSLHRMTDEILVYGPGSPTGWLSIATIERASELGASSFLVGYLGDEWLSLAGGPVAQAVNDNDWRRVPAYLKAYLDEDELHVRYIPSYLGWLAASSAKQGTTYANRVLDHFHGSGSLQMTLTTIERAACVYDIALGMPFADRDYVSFVLGLPAWQRNRPGEPKWLLRQAFADALPEPYVTSPIKANFYDVVSLALDGRRTGPAAEWFVRASWVDAWRQALAELSA